MCRLIFILAFLLHVFFSTAQVGTTSPYSSFGLGDLHGVVISEYASMGGGATALQSLNSINPFNPATYAYINPNSFLLSSGLRHNIINIENVNESQINHTTAYSHFIVGFPINKKIGASIGMLPYSDMGYNINTYDDFDSELIYSGDGGITKIYFGGGYSVNKNLSIGVNASYLFGRLNKRKKVLFNNDSFLNSRSNSSINLKGYYYELGLFYKKDVSKDQKISLGLILNNDSEIRAKRNYLIETFEYGGSVEFAKDTVVNTEEWGYLNLPKSVNLGFSYQKNNKLLFVTDYSIQNWVDYKIFDIQEDYNNSRRFSTGIQYSPEYTNITEKYYNKLKYRLGFAYTESPLQFDDIKLNELSVSFGIGIPAFKSRTKYDISFIFSERGIVEDNLIKEQFLKIGLNISYDGVWFVKRKYD